MPEGTLSLSSAYRRHIKFIYEVACEILSTDVIKSRDNLDFLCDDFLLANQGVL